MKLFLAVLLVFCGALTVTAQAPSYSGALRTPEELDQIYAPIALYPDALVALILPAATVPNDITSAAAYLQANGDPNQVAGQPWNDSVKSLVHYPEVVKWMNDNLAWTEQAGDAFLAQPQDVMKSIQQLRARAVAAGSLANTPQQQVITDDNEIRIVPAQPDVVYVPYYDPDVVYDEQPGYDGPWLTFGPGYPEGLWLNYDLDWDHYGIWIGQWHPGWDYRHPVWHHPIAGGPAYGHAWRPDSRPREVRPFGGDRRLQPIVHPRPFAGAPPRPPQAVRAPSPGPAYRPEHAVVPTRPDFRGYPSGGQNRPATVTPAPAPSHVFGGYNRGSDTRAASQRGQVSRQAARPAPAPAPRPSAPSPQRSGGSERRKD